MITANRILIATPHSMIKLVTVDDASSLSICIKRKFSVTLQTTKNDMNNNRSQVEAEVSG